MEKENEDAKPMENNTSINKILKSFKTNVTSLLYYYQNFEGLAIDADKTEENNREKSLKDVFDNLSIKIPANGTDKEGLDLFREQLLEVAKNKPEALVHGMENFVATKKKMPTKHFEIFSRGAFIMLNNYFEYLLSDLTSYYYTKYQGSFKDKKIKFTLKELEQYETIAEVAKAFIDQKVESLILSLTFQELLQHFEDKLKISNEKELINWKLITEYRERRHLIVHNASKVNKKYQIRTGNICKFDIGDFVHIDKEYFLKSCNEYYLAGLLIAYNCWGQWDSKEVNKCVINILDESFTLLQNKEYDMNWKLTTYAKKIEPRTVVQQDCLARINFNKLISLKQSDKKVELAKELKNIQIGTMAPIFKLVYAILADENDDILPLIKQVKDLGELKLRQYETWPIFDFIRGIDKLNESIKNILIPKKIIEINPMPDSDEPENSK